MNTFWFYWNELDNMFLVQVGTEEDQVPLDWQSRVGRPLLSYPGSHSYLIDRIEKLLQNTYLSIFIMNNNTLIPPKFIIISIAPVNSSPVQF